MTAIVDEKREKAAGRARVAKDSLDLSGFQAQESEQKALADQALADFAASEGIVMDTPPGTKATPATDVTLKTMGPEQREVQ